MALLLYRIGAPLDVIKAMVGASHETIRRWTEHCRHIRGRKRGYSQRLHLAVRARRKLRQYRAPIRDVRRTPKAKLPTSIRGNWMTLEEIGAEMGKSRERIRQVESSALRKLRGPLGLPLQRWVEEVQP